MTIKNIQKTIYNARSVEDAADKVIEESLYSGKVISATFAKLVVDCGDRYNGNTFKYIFDIQIDIKDI